MRMRPTRPIWASSVERVALACPMGFRELREQRFDPSGERLSPPAFTARFEKRLPFFELQRQERGHPVGKSPWVVVILGQPRLAKEDLMALSERPDQLALFREVEHRRLIRDVLN